MPRKLSNLGKKMKVKGKNPFAGLTKLASGKNALTYKSNVQAGAKK